MPNFLGSESSFTNQFAKPIINGQKLEASASDMKKGTNCLKILHQQVLPFVLRREKGQVMKELPPKIITNIPCVLSSHQKRFYKAAMEQNDTKAALDLMDNVIKSSEETVQYSDTQKLRSNTLTSLLQLRMICTHPILYSLFKTKDEAHLNISLARLDSSGKLMALNDILRHSRLAGPEITAADNDSSGFQLDFIDDIASGVEDNILIDDGCVEDTIDRDTNEHESTTNEQSKCLIFAQFTQSLDVVEQFLFEPHMPSLEYLRLDGNVPSNQRSAIVDKFNEDKNIKVLLLTTKVGGLGLNLTGKYVIFLSSYLLPPPRKLTMNDP
jgi:TATA-binding protein-associated factor